MPEDTPIPPTPVSPSSPVMPALPELKPTGGGFKSLMYALVVVILIAGAGIGVLVYMSRADKQAQQPVAVVDSEIKLPPDATLLQSCADRKGALYARPSDIPTGPIYMVQSGKVIGIEFMLDQAEFLANKSFTGLEAAGVKVHHANVGLVSKGHEGFPKPHYHVDLYTVDAETEQAISCPKK